MHCKDTILRTQNNWPYSKLIPNSGMEYILIESLKNHSFRTQWEEWVLELAEAIRQTDIRVPRTWTVLEPLAGNTPAMIWLTEKLRKLQPAPSFENKTETALYILASFCRNNRVLGYVIDTYMHQYKKRNTHGLLVCAKILHAISPEEEYPHLNFLYNLMAGNVISEFKRHLKTNDSFMTESDFRLAGKYIPDFNGAGFRETVLLRVTANITGEELAKKCNMSNIVFRERFKREFGMNVSQWLRERKKERIAGMLKNPAIPLYRVAENNGFRSESTFSDYCRRNFNKTPLQLRKELLAGTVR